MPKLKCCGCKERFPAETMINLNGSRFHAIDCATAYAQAKGKKAIERSRAKAKRMDQVKRKQLKASLIKRTGKGGYYEKLKIEVHFYVKHVLRKGEPCYTCDKPQSFGDSGQAFHVGHFMPAKSVDPRRFMLINLRIQCYKCNKILSGNQAEYRKRLEAEIGKDQVEWLECVVNHKELTEVFPNVEDITAEAKRYRALNKPYRNT